MRHATIYKILKLTAQKAGIKKRIDPHLFRHSRATALASKLTEAQLKEHFGWTKDSGMATTYVHFSGRDVDHTLLKLHGFVEADNQEEEKMKVHVCTRCKENNSPISKFCTRCGTILDVGLAASIVEQRKAGDNLMNKLMEDKEFKDLMMKKIFEMNLDKNFLG